MKRYHLTVTKLIKRCGDECPNWEHHDGMGHCEDWFRCKGDLQGRDPREDRWNQPSGFPKWCPLMDVEATEK